MQNFKYQTGDIVTDLDKLFIFEIISYIDNGEMKGCYYVRGLNKVPNISKDNAGNEYYIKDIFEKNTKKCLIEMRKRKLKSLK